MPLPLHVPTCVGIAALDELGAVPWRLLDHAYGTGITAPGLHADVEGSLRTLGSRPPEAMHALYSNICHQGTVYEATAYAAPFVIAIACGDVAPSLRLQLVELLAAIALSASHETEDGSRAGSFGDGVDELIRDALARCAPRLELIAAAEPATAEIVAAIAAIVATPGRATFDALSKAQHALTADLDAHDQAAEAAPPAQPASHERYHHATFGDATLVRRIESKLMLKFDDGKDRVLLARSVTRIDE